MRKNILRFTISILVAAALITPATVQAAIPRTSTTFTSSATTGINVIPYVRSDKKALFIDFDHFTPNMDYIYYNLNYTDKNTGVKGGIEGSFLTNPLPKSGKYDGYDFVRREFLFGTCSKNSCRYNTPKNVTLTVNTHYSKGKTVQHTKVINFLDSQF